MTTPIEPEWQSLTDEQLAELNAIVQEEFQKELSQQSFNDAALGLLEDVAGFEIVEDVDPLLANLWNNYRNNR